MYMFINMCNITCFHVVVCRHRVLLIIEFNRYLLPLTTDNYSTFAFVCNLQITTALSNAFYSVISLCTYCFVMASNNEGSPHYLCPQCLHSHQVRILISQLGKLLLALASTVIFGSGSHRTPYFSASEIWDLVWFR